MKNIVILGSGNVASHLAKQFYKKGYHILQIYSPHIKHAELLAKQVDATAIDDLKKLMTNADLYLLSVTDSAIKEVISEITFEPKLITHTAGSIPLNSLAQFPNFGVFYPLQSFSKDRQLDFSSIPFCIEANTIENEEKLINLAKHISSNVQILTSAQRMQCHLAAVFANNFTNHLYSIANQILAEKNIPFDIIKPLILETAQKVQEFSPAKAQTGPAVRNNKAVIENHIEQLSSPELEKLYSFVSESIMAYHNKE